MTKEQKKIAVLPGDGIGPEVIGQALKVLEAVKSSARYELSTKEALVGAHAIDVEGDPFPASTEKICRESDAILFGAIGHPKYDNDPKAKVRPERGLLGMRKSLGLYANIRPVTSYPELADLSPLKKGIIQHVDFVVFRELTGGIYFGKPRGRSEDGQTAYDTCVYSKEEIIRVSKLAFEAARLRNNQVTLVDKANVLATSRLWRETVKQLSEQYSDVELDFLFVDNAAMKIIQNPGDFDVVLTENMFGDIITDEASVITGSLGMLPSASMGDQVGLYEPIHGSWPEAAGQNRANPIAAILSLAMLFEYSFGMKTESDRIRDAVSNVIQDRYLTEDLNPGDPKTCEEVGSRIANHVTESSAVAH